MSVYQCGQTHHMRARMIANFLYVDGKGNNGFKEHTVEEYREELESIMTSCFDEYNSIAKEMGWIE
jgi:hypothetical protein